jgi:hypothetical protein
MFLDQLGDYDLVNADEEYTTQGKFNFLNQIALMNYLVTVH